jgi:GT2 family glycosyltransferase
MTSITPEVSIVIPLYGGAAFTRVCLESIRTNTAIPYRIILVDDASPDDETHQLLEELSADATCLILRQPHNSGFAKACNRGLMASSTAFSILLNNDTEVLPNWLEPLIQSMDDPTVAAAGCLLLYPGGQLVQHAGIELTRKGSELRAFHRGQYWRVEQLPWVHETCDLPAVTGACLMLRMDALPGGIRLDEDYCNGYEDVDLCLQLRSAGWKVRYCGNSKVLHHESVSVGRFQREKTNQSIFLQKWNEFRISLPLAMGKWEIQDRRARREYLLSSTPSKASKVLALLAKPGMPSVCDEKQLWKRLAAGKWLPWLRISGQERSEIHEQLGFIGMRIRV